MTTDERLEKLERELSRARTRFRWLVVGAGLCFMSVAVIYAYGQYRTGFLPRATEASKEIRANNFVVNRHLKVYQFWESKSVPPDGVERAYAGKVDTISPPSLGYDLLKPWSFNR